MIRLGIAAISALLISGANARADAFESAETLPKGRFRVSAIYGRSAEVTQVFDPMGQAQSITAPYNFALDAAKIKTLDVPQFQDLVNALNASGWHYNVNKRGNGMYGMTRDASDPQLGDSLARGFLNVDANGMREQVNALASYGITDWLSVGITVPYVRYSVRVNHSITGVNTAADIWRGYAADNAALSPEMQSGLYRLQSVNDDTLQGLLADRGYAKLADYNGSGLGDITLGSRIAYLNGKRFLGGDWTNAFQLYASVPTGAVAPPSEMTMPSYGRGAWDLQAAHITNYSPFSWLALSQGVHFDYRFFSHRLMRVRKDPSDVIPDLSDEENAGDQIGSELAVTTGARFSPWSFLQIDAGYSFGWKAADVFTGAKTDRDYGYLSGQFPYADTYTETLALGLTLTSREAFLRHKFPLPGDLSINAYVPTRGRNVYIAPYASAELALYF